MIKIILIVLLAEIFNTAGNVLFKKSLNSIGFHSLKEFKLYLIFLKNVLMNPFIWLGLVSMGLCMITWLLALAGADLNLVFSLGSLQYVLVLFSAKIFLNEKIDNMKALGTASIILGIVLVVIK